MTFEEVITLLDNEILPFLKTCGGVYTDITSEVELNIIECLALGQYVWTQDCFICYWKIHPTDVDSLKERIKPHDRIFGTTIYVVECACRRNLRKAISVLRKQVPECAGVFWHRPIKEDKVYYFPSQKGEERMNDGK